MTPQASPNPRPAGRAQTRGEELANSISHGLGCLVALLAAPELIARMARQGNTTHVIGAGVFAITMILLYFSSALYHATPPGQIKGRRATIDHCAIYLFIAGSYTPFALGVLEGAWGWFLLLAIWSLAALGLALKTCGRLSHPGLSTGLYLAMGWLVTVAAVPLQQRLATPGLVLLISGGLAYTLGTVFYLSDARIRFGHFIWHLFVMTGTTCHFFAVLWYSA
jgi:hemolysin III